MKRLVPLVAACLALSSCAVTPSSQQGGGPSATTGQTPPGTVTCSYRVTGSPAKPVDPPETKDVPATGTVGVTIQLGGSEVALQLDRAAAPCTVNSFESLARQGWYDGTTCHRLATTGIFILQCGDPTGTGRGGPGYTFDDEIAPGTTYPAGAVAMANSGPDTNGSQFFLVFADTPLRADYTVFGTMSSAGTQAVADLAFQGHDNSFGDGTGRPNAPATITSVALG